LTDPQKIIVAAAQLASIFVQLRPLLDLINLMQGNVFLT